ncbi:hypothetical protein [Streptomyces sp. NPDC050121]|uniref:hypothetical protein n=1 Tax=Streptomyces sp. NPDC050121 TaxID=3365601 RepID=UPI00379B8266
MFVGFNVRNDLPCRFNELDVLRRHWARFAAVSQGSVVPPYEVLIHPSSGCNLRCAWCIGDHVPLELWDEQREQLVMLDAAKDAVDLLPDHLTTPANMLKLIGDIVDYEVEAPYRQSGEDCSGVFKVEAVSFSGLIGEPLVARKALIPAFGLLAERGMSDSQELWMGPFDGVISAAASRAFSRTFEAVLADNSAAVALSVTTSTYGHLQLHRAWPR